MFWRLIAIECKHTSPIYCLELSIARAGSGRTLHIRVPISLLSVLDRLVEYYNETVSAQTIHSAHPTKLPSRTRKLLRIVNCREEQIMYTTVRASRIFISRGAFLHFHGILHLQSGKLFAISPLSSLSLFIFLSLSFYLSLSLSSVPCYCNVRIACIVSLPKLWDNASTKREVPTAVDSTRLEVVSLGQGLLNVCWAYICIDINLIVCLL
jgi:hypothetical protein